MADLQSKVKQVRMVEKICKHDFHYDTKELFEPITKAVTDTSQKLLEETKSTTKTIEEVEESNVPVEIFKLLKKWRF